MAKRKSEYTFYCEVCEKGFEYKSKYARHLESGSHKMFAESLTFGLRTYEQDSVNELSLTPSPPHLFDNITEEVL